MSTANIYFPDDLKAQIDHFAKHGLVIPMNRSQLTKLLYEALFSDPVRVLGDKVRKPDHPFNGTPEQNYQTLRSFAPESSTPED